MAASHPSNPRRGLTEPDPTYPYEGKSFPGIRKVVALAEAQNWRCAYRGCVMQVGEGATWNAATVDHVQPLSRGGARVWLNEVAACQACNKERDVRDAYEYFAMVSHLGPRTEAPLSKRALKRRERRRRRWWHQQQRATLGELARVKGRGG